MLGTRRRSAGGLGVALSALAACTGWLAWGAPALAQEESSGDPATTAQAPAPEDTAWLWNRQVEVWVGEESAAFGGVDLAFVRTEADAGYRLRFSVAQVHRDWSLGNPRVIDIEHDQAAQFDGLELTMRPVDMGPRWTVDVDGPLLEGFRQNAAQAAESARVAGRFPEFARHIDLAMEARLSNAALAGRHAASWLQATRLVGPRPDLPRVGQPYWIGDPLLERGVFGAAGAWLSVSAPSGADGAPAAQPGEALESGRAVLTPESLEAYVAAQRSGGWTTEVGGAFEWSLGEPDDGGRRGVECRLTFQEGVQRWSLVDRFTPLPLDDPLFGEREGAVAPAEAPDPGR